MTFSFKGLGILFGMACNANSLMEWWGGKVRNASLEARY